jgi:hypothetical protein
VATDLEYVCDDSRHLVCVPFSIENLHRMAGELNICKCWYHASSNHPHYDIPNRRVAEITARCRVVTSFELLAICRV